jgi:hypothetical protein
MNRLLTRMVPGLLIVSGTLGVAVSSAHVGHSHHETALALSLSSVEFPYDRQPNPGAPGDPHESQCVLCVHTAAPALAGRSGSVPRFPVESVWIERGVRSAVPAASRDRHNPPVRGPPVQ